MPILRDLHHNIKVVHAIYPQSLGATGSGGVVSKIIDTQGFEAKEIAFHYGAIAATGATVGVKILEGDATGAMATVATSANLIGSPALSALSGLLGISATSARASGVSNKVNKRVGYIGPHRYLQVKLIPAVSGGIIAAANVILGGAHANPTTSAPN